MICADSTQVFIAHIHVIFLMNNMLCFKCKMQIVQSAFCFFASMCYNTVQTFIMFSSLRAIHNFFNAFVFAYCIFSIICMCSITFINLMLLMNTILNQDTGFKLLACTTQHIAHLSIQFYLGNVSGCSCFHMILFSDGFVYLNAAITIAKYKN